jgi:LETM1 and EF-hand domain-containing protein 1
MRSPDEEQINVLMEKLDVDKDGFVPLTDILSLAEGEGLGIIIDDPKQTDVPSAETAASILSQGRSIRSDGKEMRSQEKLRKEDVVADA